MESLTTVPLLIIDDFGMRKLPMTGSSSGFSDDWTKSFPARSPCIW